MILSVSDKEVLIDDDDWSWLSKFTLKVYNDKSRKCNYVHCFRSGDSKSYLLHRLILDAQENEIVDHINRNVLDCRKNNLRFASKTESNRNRTFSNNELGFRGIRMSNKKDFRAAIRVNGKRLHLGCFKTIEEAVDAYDKAAKKYHGEFAVLNRKEI